MISLGIRKQRYMTSGKYNITPTCLMHSTIPCWTPTSSSFILVMNISLLGHWTAAPSNKRISSFMFSNPSFNSGVFPRLTHSGRMRRVWPSSSSNSAFIFFTMQSKFLTLPMINVFSSKPSRQAIWWGGSGSIWRTTSFNKCPFHREE